MIICSCSNISDTDSKQEVVEKVKNTKTNCKQCPFFKMKGKHDKKENCGNIRTA